MTRGPRLHAVNTTPDGDWTCTCGKAGNTAGPAGQQQHLDTAARAAFTRLDHSHAWATLSVTSACGSRLDQWATGILYNSRLWYGTSTLRPYMHPFYDHYGVLSARLDWQRLARALHAGDVFPDDEALLLLRVALSLLGLHRINLIDLEKINHPADRRSVRDVLNRLLPEDV